MQGVENGQLRQRGGNYMMKALIVGVGLCLVLATAPGWAIPPLPGADPGCTGSFDCWDPFAANGGIAFEDGWWWNTGSDAVDLWLLPNTMTTPSGRPAWAMDPVTGGGVTSQLLTWDLGTSYGTPVYPSGPPGQAFHQIVRRGSTSPDHTVWSYLFGNTTDLPYRGQGGTLLFADLTTGTGVAQDWGILRFGPNLSGQTWSFIDAPAGTNTARDYNQPERFNFSTPELGTWLLLGCTGLVGLVPTLRRRRK